MFGVAGAFDDDESRSKRNNSLGTPPCSVTHHKDGGGNGDTEGDVVGSEVRGRYGLREQDVLASNVLGRVGGHGPAGNLGRGTSSASKHV